VAAGPEPADGRLWEVVGDAPFAVLEDELATAEQEIAAGEPEKPEKAEEPERRGLLGDTTLLEQMGGVAGIVYSSLPVLVFIGVNTVTSLQPALIASVSSGVAIAIWRLIRRQPVQPAVSGLLGVLVAAFIAYRTGTAKGFFLFGIWASLVYAVALLVSIVARWPAIGVAWHGINGRGHGWRDDRAMLRAYDIATLAWVLVFGARFVVQRWLYDSDLTGWLAAARIGMGIPLTALAVLVTVWTVRRAGRSENAGTDPGAHAAG
jgi:hypothetical protein